jgi:hypothetical protein
LGQSLTASASIGGGYDDNVLAGNRVGGGGTGNSLRAPRGQYGYGFARLAYSLAHPRVAVGASATSTSRYYPGLLDEFVSSYGYGGNVTLSLQVREATRLTFSPTMSRRPYSLLQLFPIAPDASNPGTEVPEEDLAIADADYVTYGGAVGVSQRLSERNSLGFDYTYRRSRVATSSDAVNGHQAGSILALGLTRHLGARLGYRFRQSRYSGTGGHRGEVHNLIAGVDYNRPLSISRRTSLSFSTGSSAATYAGRTVYRAVGDAQLTHEIGRTWYASVGYDRGVSFIDTFDQPFVYDAATASVDGLISRRVAFHTALRAAFGHVGLSRGRPYNTYSGVVGLSVAISRYLAAGTSYLYHRYRFDDAAVLPAGVGGRMDRQGLRAYISVWAPLFYRGRAPDATR